MNTVKKEKFSKSIGYLFISQVLIKMLGLLYSLYLINKPTFGDKGNAIYLSGYQIFALMLTFSSIGVPSGVSNLIAKADNYAMLNKIFKVALVLYVFIASISSLVLFSFSNIIAKDFIGIEAVSYNLKLLAPILIITTLESVYTGFFYGIKQMKITAQIQFIEQLFKTIFTIVLVEILSRITSNPEVMSVGATLAVSFSVFISFLISYNRKKNIQIYTKEFSNTNLSCKEIIKRLLQFSIPISIGAMFVGINKNCDSFVIMNVLAEKIGTDEAQKIYGIIASKVEVLVILPLSFNIAFSTALIPNISEAKRNNDSRSIKLYIENSIFMSLAIGIASSFGLYFFAEEIFEILFSNSQNGVQLLKIAAFSIIFSVLNQTFSGILQGFEKNKFTVMATFCGCMTKIIFNFIFVNQDMFLEKGIILSSILSNFVMCIILFCGVRKNIKFSFKRYFCSLLLAGIIMIVLIIIMRAFLAYISINNKISLIISMLVGCIVFLQEILVISKVFSFLKMKQKTFLV